MTSEAHHKSPEESKNNFNNDLTNSLKEITAEQEQHESAFIIQSPQEFRDDFVAAVQNATSQVGLETMQFEIGVDTVPIFEAIVEAKHRGVGDVRFHYDRFARSTIRAGGKGSVVLGGRAMHYRKPIKVANTKREQLIDELELIGIADPANKKRGEYEHRSHNHVKLAIVDDVAWFGTMNLRESDFEMSNFMMKITDPRWVEKLKEIFEQTEKNDFGEDKLFTIEGDGSHQTELLLDTGAKEQSLIYDRALSMVDSLNEGDEFVIISQWPPEKMMFGNIMEKLNEKMLQGARGTFLMSPPKDLHPIPQLSPLLQWSVDKKQRKNNNLTAINLARKTHAKAFVIKRANGETEVLFGSHNFTSSTVKNGTRELAMWSRDPKVVSEIMGFIDQVQKEK